MHRRVESWSKPIIAEIQAIDTKAPGSRHLLNHLHAEELNSARKIVDDFKGKHLPEKRFKLKTNPSGPVFSQFRTQVNSHLAVANACLTRLVGQRGHRWTFESLVCQMSEKGTKPNYLKLLSKKVR